MAPLQDLLDYLQEAVQTPSPNDTISIPRNIINALLHLPPTPTPPDLDGLVALLDGPNGETCSRLDVASFQCLLYVFLAGEWALMQERGLYFFLNSIKQLTQTIRNAKDTKVATASRRLKSMIGQKTLQLCLTYFTDIDGPGIPRRWSGQILLELIRESEENKELLVLGPEETRRGLGKVVLQEPDCVLRFIAADIIREMVALEFDRNIFWPFRSSDKLIAAFPSGALVDRAWIESFHSFISEVENNGHNHGAAHGQYVCVVKYMATDDLQPPQNDSALVAVGSKYLNFIVATRDTDVQFLRLSFDDIEKSAISTGGGNNLSSVTGNNYILLDLDLAQRVNGNYTKNGSTMSVDKFSLIFRGRQQATNLLMAIEQRMPRQLNRAEIPTDTEDAIRHISAAYISLGEGDSPTNILPHAQPIVPKKRLDTKISRVASFAILSLPSQEDVVAQSSAFINGHHFLKNEAASTSDSGGSTEMGGFLEVMGTPSQPVIEATAVEGAASARGRDEGESSESKSSPYATSVSPGSENAPTTSLSNEGQPLDFHGYAGVKNDVSTQDGNLEGSMRLQQDEGPDAYSGMPSPIQEAPPPRSPDKNNDNNLARQASTPLEYNQPQEDHHPVFPDPNLSYSRKPRIISEVPDSQPQAPGPEEAQTAKSMAPTETISLVGVQPPPNVIDTPITPAETVAVSKLKRPRQKVIGGSEKRDMVDWDQDLRVSGDDQKISSIKKQKTAQFKTPMPPRSKSVHAPKQNRQTKAPPKTPKNVAISSTARKPRMPRKRPPTKTLTSSRQLRAAAGKANERIAKVKYDESGNFDVDDPIETTSPEPSPLETPVVKREVRKTASNLGKPTVLDAPAGGMVPPGDVFDPIILDSSAGDEVNHPHPPPENVKPVPVIEDFVDPRMPVTDLESPIVCNDDPQFEFQDIGNFSPPKDGISLTNDTPVAEKDPQPIQFDDTQPPPKPALIYPNQTDVVGSKKPSFAEKLSRALAGTGILPVENVDTREGPILLIDQSSPNPEAEPLENEVGMRKERVSKVSQNVAAFRSRKSAVGALLSDAENIISTRALPDLTPEIGALNLVSTSHMNEVTCSLGIPAQEETNTNTSTKAFSKANGRGSKPPDPFHKSVLKTAAKLPMKEVESTRQPGSALVDERLHRKTQVVSFDIDGPRNQGLSCKKELAIVPSRPLQSPIKMAQIPTASKRKTPVGLDQENVVPGRDDGDERKPTPTAKRQRIDSIPAEPDEIAGGDSDSVIELMRPELLSQTRPPQLFSSQQSRVDMNGSPRQISRVNHGSHLLIKTQTITGKGREAKESRTTASTETAVKPNDYKLTMAAPTDVESSSGRSAPSLQGDSDEENIELFYSNSGPKGKEIVPNALREPACSQPPMPKSGVSFLFPKSRTPDDPEPPRPIKKRVEKLELKKRIVPIGGSEERSLFRHSLFAGLESMDCGSDVDSGAETGVLDDVVESMSDYSTDSSSFQSSETLIEGDIDPDLEWRNTLRSTQKTTLDILLDTSKRLVRHLVDEETAIMDIVTSYQNGCEKLLKKLQQALDTSLEGRERHIQPLKKDLIGVYEAARSRLKAGRAEIQKLPSSKELLSAVQERKGLLYRFDDVMNEYGQEDD